MTHPDKLITGVAAIVLLTGSGCAGTGLRNLLSRDETAGFKSLEELEAEESREQEEAVADSGPRFAPWLPFGRKADSTTEDQAVAASDQMDDTETEKSAWWKRPFRKEDVVETDPFLAADDEAPDRIRTERTPPARTKTQSEEDSPVVASDSNSTTRKNASKKESAEESTFEKSVVRPVSDARRKEAENLASRAADEELAEKFERHFQENTVEAADATERAERLIVAGKTTAAAADRPKPPADKVSGKLEELERLLTEKETQARKLSRDAGEKAAALPNEAADFFAAASSGTAEKRPTTRSASGSEVKPRNAPASFDDLFSDSPAAGVVTASAEEWETPRPKAATRTATPAPVQTVDVSDAEMLFGPAPSGTSRSRFGSATKSGVRTVPGDDFNWSSSQSQPESGAAARGRATLAGTGTPAQTSDPLPAARITDAPESSFRFGSRSRSTSVKPVSSNRTTAVRAASRGSEEGFFTSAPIENRSKTTAVKPVSLSRAAAAIAAVPPQEPAAGGIFSRFSPRNWLLLICGIIVVALLFAPGRKKPIQVNQTGTQG